MTKGLSLAAFTLCLMLSNPAQGKDWDFEYSYVAAFVNMTPDAESTKASSGCVQTIRSEIDKNNWQVNFRKVGETKARKLVDRPKGGPHFLEWEPSRFTNEGWVKMKAPWPKETEASYVVLVDCRPEKQVLDIMVAYPEDHRYFRRVSLRHVALTKELLRAAGRRVL